MGEVFAGAAKRFLSPRLAENRWLNSATAYTPKCVSVDTMADTLRQVSAPSLSKKRSSNGHFQLSSSKRPGIGEALPVPVNYRVIVSATGTVSVRGGRHTRSLHD